MNACGLTVLSLTLGFAVVKGGGVWTRDWNVCLLAIALFTLIYRLRARSDQAPPLDRKSQWLLLVVAAFAAVQLVPLPLSVLHLLSPVRADLLTATVPVLGPARLAPLTTAPAATVEHWMRLGGYLLVFLLVRDLSWRLSDSPWLPALPLVVLATLEAALGLLQSYSPGSDGIARGTYVNRDHFAGFLEMCLPFAVLYPVAVLRRTRSRHVSPAAPAWKACGLLSIAALILVAILHSLSRMGFLASLASLVAIACFALGAKRRGWKRWLPIGSLAVLMLLAFILLPSDPLIARYAELAPAGAISSDMRVGLSRDTLGLIKAFPLFGCGLGAYESCFPRYQAVAPMYTIDFAHNDYLQYLSELGAPAFLAGLLFVLGIFRQAVRAGMGEPSNDRRYVALACTGSFVAIFLDSFVDFNLYIPSNAMLLAWIAGIAATSLHSGWSNPSSRGVNVGPSPISGHLGVVNK
jgi:O-antigen ligase